MDETKRRFPRVSDRHEDGKVVLVVEWREGEGAEEFCGESWCSGSCGRPALVIPGEREQKAYSSMTACGPLMQDWRLKWVGTKREVPAEFRDDLMRRMWF